MSDLRLGLSTKLCLDPIVSFSMLKFSVSAHLPNTAVTFFSDVNGDKYLDAYELEAIFQYELDKIYDPEKVSLVSIWCCLDWRTNQQARAQ